MVFKTIKDAGDVPNKLESTAADYTIAMRQLKIGAAVSFSGTGSDFTVLRNKIQGSIRYINTRKQGKGLLVSRFRREFAPPELWVYCVAR